MPLLFKNFWNRKLLYHPHNASQSLISEHKCSAKRSALFSITSLRTYNIESMKTNIRYAKSQIVDHKIQTLHYVLAILLIFVLGFLIYSNTFESSFHFDDKQNIQENINIRSLSNLDEIWNRGEKRRWITQASFALNYHFTRFDLPPIHFVNIFIHCTSSFMVFLLVLLFLKSPPMIKHPFHSNRYTISLITALLFLCHPIQTQAVTYIVQRATSLATCFYFAALVCYLQARLEHKNKPCWYGLVFAASFVAYFSKEISYTLPFAVLLVEWLVLGADRRQIRRQAPVLMLFFASLAAVYFICYHRAVAAGHIQSVTQVSGAGINRTNYLLTQFSVLLTYLKLLFFPVGLNIDHHFPLSHNFLEPKTLFSFLAIASMLVTGFLIRKRYRLIAFGIFWFFLTLSIESSVFPLRDVIFEHRAYLPIVGFLLVFVNILYLFLRHMTALKLVCAGIILVLSFLSYQRNAVWKDEISLWSDAVRKSPEKDRTYVNLGIAYDDANMPTESEKAFKKAIELDPKNPPAYNAMGSLYHRTGNYKDAIRAYQKAHKMQPEYGQPVYNLGLAYSKTGDFDKAIQMYKYLLADGSEFMVKPPLEQIYFNLGIAYGRKGDLDRAIDSFQDALDVDPEHVTALKNIGVAYIKKGKPDSVRPYILRLKRLGANEEANYLQTAIRNDSP